MPKKQKRGPSFDRALEGLNRYAKAHPDQTFVVVAFKHDKPYQRMSV